MRRRLPFLLALLSLATASPATAGSARVAFDGGTRAEQAQVRAALDASAFDFGLLPEVAVHITPGAATMSQRGHVWIDARLLNAGRFAWAPVLDEFAHQVDFLLFDDTQRSVLNTQLGGKDWCYGVRGLAHSDYGCERFSSTFAWAFWPSADNSYKPRSASDESAAMPPGKFRALVGALLGFVDPLAARAVAASAQRQTLAHKSKR